MTNNNSRADVLVYTCLALEAGSAHAAEKIIAAGFPFSGYLNDEKPLSKIANCSTRR